MQIFDTVITHHELLCDNMLFIKVLTNKNHNELGLPGQFYQVKVPGDDFQIRVPLSIYDISKITNTTQEKSGCGGLLNKPEDKSQSELGTTTSQSELGTTGDAVSIEMNEGSEISFLIKVVGEKTQAIKGMKVGDTLNIIGPLGNSFSVNEKEKYMFVSGGCGYAPLNFLYRFTNKNKVTWIHGGRTKDEVKFAVDGKKAQIICTDDGSEGIKGFVTSEVSKELYIQNYDKVFACGPDPMLHEVMSICRLFNKKLYVSMEAYMGCGIGVCYGCAIKLRNIKGKYTYARVCKDGPIFNAYAIVWEELSL